MPEQNTGIYPPDFYTTLEDATVEVKRRWNDLELRKKVEVFLGDLLFEQLKNEPCAMLSRDIISPDLEFHHFLEVCSKVNLKPLFLEYADDKFVAKNDDKYHLCKLYFYDPGAPKYAQITNVKMVDFNKWEGKSFSVIQTLENENLVEFHHRILSKLFPGIKDSIIPFSDWFNNTRYSTEYYYYYFFALFICHGVLFENFLTEDKEELAFTLEKVVPSFNKMKEIFGVKPLIVPMAPLDSESELYWWCYPQKVKELITKSPV